MITLKPKARKAAPRYHCNVKSATALRSFLQARGTVQAMKIKNFLVKKGVKFLSDTSTNQIFPILENTVIEKLSEDFEFYVWQKVDENFSAIRLITSWNTKDSATDCFLESLDKIL